MNVAIFEKVSFEEWIGGGKGTDESEYGQIKLPKRATKGSAGYDFFAPFSFYLKPGETVIVPTGVRCNIEEGWFLMCVPKSGLGFKFRLQLDNTVGIIDSDYYDSKNEGHIMAKITNDSKAAKKLSIKKGEAFMQGIFLSYGLTFDDETSGIRTGGFGSTKAFN